MPYPPENSRRDHLWFSEREDGNPYGHSPFGDGPPPPPRKAQGRPKPPPAPRREEPSDDVLHLDFGQEPASKTPPVEAPKSPGGDALGPVDLVIPDNPDESENPYAPANAPRGQNRPLGHLHAPSAASVPIPEYRPPGRGLVIKETLLDLLPPLPILLISIVAFLLVLGGFAIWPYLTITMEDNEPPVAVITEPESLLVTENDRIILDAGRSFDPEGEALTFQWRYTSPEGEEIIISEVSGARRMRRGTFVTTSEQVLVHFIDPGSITLNLMVNDGVHYSDPVQVTFEIEPLVR